MYKAFVLRIESRRDSDWLTRTGKRKKSRVKGGKEKETDGKTRKAKGTRGTHGDVGWRDAR